MRNPIPRFIKAKRNTGLYSMGHPYSYGEIIFEKKKIGYIGSPSWEQDKDKKGWYIMIIVENFPASEKYDGNPNCPWRNIKLAGRWETEQQTQEFFLKNWEKISTKFKISPQDRN